MDHRQALEPSSRRRVLQAMLHPAGKKLMKAAMLSAALTSFRSLSDAPAAPAILAYKQLKQALASALLSANILT